MNTRRRRREAPAGGQGKTEAVGQPDPPPISLLRIDESNPVGQRKDDHCNFSRSAAVSEGSEPANEVQNV